MSCPTPASTARELSSGCWTKEGAWSRLASARVTSSRSGRSPRSSPRRSSPTWCAAVKSGLTIRSRDIGSTYEYSNLGVGLLGHALALKAGTSYEQLVTRRILTPLGMTETAITLTPAMRGRLALGHDGEGKVVPNWDLPTLAGAGALRSTAADLIAFLVANLDSTATPLSRTLQQTHGERHATNDPNLKIGLAWHILSRPTGKIVWHNGGTGGYRSFIGFDPARRIGVVVLCNDGNENVDDIGFHVLDETFSLTEVAVDSLVLQRYVGDYELAPTFHIV